MKELRQRILDDAQVGEGDIIHVDMFQPLHGCGTHRADRQ